MYTYYINANGEEVRHGWEYLILANKLNKSRYEHGAVKEFEGHSIHQ